MYGVRATAIAGVGSYGPRYPQVWPSSHMSQYYYVVVSVLSCPRYDTSQQNKCNIAKHHHQRELVKC